MIRARFRMDELTLTVSFRMDGHSGMADKGNDLLCAAASILAMTLAQNAVTMRGMGLLKYDPHIIGEDGRALVTCRARNTECFNDILRTYMAIQEGFRLLAENHPEHFSLTRFDQGTVAPANIETDSPTGNGQKGQQ